MSEFFKVVNGFSSRQWLTMLQMQDELNSRINPNWKEQPWDYGVALADECMEFLGHLGWKWWKDSADFQKGITKENLRQLQLEVVDMIHFVLSGELAFAFYQVEDGSEEEYNQLLAQRAQDWEAVFEAHRQVTFKIHNQPEKHFFFDPEFYAKRVISQALNENDDGVGNIDTGSIYLLMCHVGMGGKDAYNTYVGKYALNKFRWDNGYAEGTYLKHWLIPSVSIQSHEDNWFLERILSELAGTGQLLADYQVYAKLDQLYSQLS